MSTAWLVWQGRRASERVREGRRRAKQQALRSAVDIWQRLVLVQTGRAWNRWVATIWHHQMSWVKMVSASHRLSVVHGRGERQSLRRSLQRWARAVGHVRASALSKQSRVDRLATVVRAWGQRKAALALRTWRRTVTRAGQRLDRVRHGVARLRVARSRWQLHWLWTCWNTWRGAVESDKLVGCLAAWGASRVWALAQLQTGRIVGRAFRRWREAVGDQRRCHAQIAGGTRSGRLIIMHWARRSLANAFGTWVMVAEGQRRREGHEQHAAVRLSRVVGRLSRLQVALAFRAWTEAIARLGGQQRGVLALARRACRRALWQSLRTWYCQISRLREQEASTGALVRRWLTRTARLAWVRWRRGVADGHRADRRVRALFRRASRTRTSMLRKGLAAWREMAAVALSKDLALGQGRLVAVMSRSVQRWRRTALGRVWRSWRTKVVAAKKGLLVASRAKNRAIHSAFRCWRARDAVHVVRVDGCSRFARFLALVLSTRRSIGLARGFWRWVTVTLGEEVGLLRRRHANARIRGASRAGLRLAFACQSWRRRRLARAWRCMHTRALVNRSLWCGALYLSRSVRTWEKHMRAKAWRAWLQSSRAVIVATAEVRGQGKEGGGGACAHPTPRPSQVHHGLACLSAATGRRKLMLTARAVRRWRSAAHAIRLHLERASTAAIRCMALLTSRERRLCARGLARWRSCCVLIRRVRRIMARWTRRHLSAGFSALRVVTAGDARADGCVG